MHQQSGNLRLAATDLSNFLSCRHLSALDAASARGGLERASRYGPVIDELKPRGMAHEQLYLEHLRDRGLRIACVGEAGRDARSDSDPTLGAMREGFDINLPGRARGRQVVGTGRLPAQGQRAE